MPETNGLVTLIGSASYFPGLTNTGLVDDVLIDPGTSDEAYAAARPSALLVTHGHADHFSSAASLRRDGVMVVAPREEASLIENPEVNVRGMFSWAKPSDEMVTKLFRGEGCPVDAYADEWSSQAIQPVPLPGHTLGHTGYLTAEGVLFSGDALYVRDLWARHPLPYTIDPALLKGSLKVIASLEPVWVVPGHGDPVCGEELADHISHHVSRVEEVEALLLGVLREPHTTEDAIAALCSRLELRQNAAQYWLAVTTVKGYLSSLVAAEAVEFYVDGHRGYWRAR